MSGTTLRTETIPASGEVALGGANFFFLISATLAVDISLQDEGTSYGATSVTGGYVKGKILPWRRGTIRGTAGTVVVFFYGDEELREDVTDFRQTIAIISGTVTVAAAPSSGIVDRAPLVTAAATTAQLVAANLSRKRVTFFSLPTNVGDAYVLLRSSGGSNDLAFIQPGTSVEFVTTARIDYRAVVGGDTLLIFEET